MKKNIIEELELEVEVIKNYTQQDVDDVLKLISQYDKLAYVQTLDDDVFVIECFENLEKIFNSVNEYFKYTNADIGIYSRVSDKYYTIDELHLIK